MIGCAKPEGTNMTTNPMPKAKTARLIVREIGDETLIYDRARNAATCLNACAATVWRQSDGKSSVAGIAASVGQDERAVWLALHQLTKSQLLTEKIALPPDMITGKSRREVAGRLGLGAAVAVVSTIAITTAAHASCGGPDARCNPFGPNTCCAPRSCSAEGFCELF
jgi:ribosomal protein S27E